MSWLSEQQDKLAHLTTELEVLNDTLERTSNPDGLQGEQYKLAVKEQYHLTQYIKVVAARIKLYCDNCTNCNECGDVTVHLVLGE